MISLRTRAVVAGVIFAIFSIIIGVFGLASYLDNQTQNRFDRLLLNEHMQLVLEVANYIDMPKKLTETVADPAYQRALSGKYWQVTAPDGTVYRSPSLGEVSLPFGGNSDTGIVVSEFNGPQDQLLRSVSEMVSFDTGETWKVQIAASLQGLNEERDQLRTNLVVAFGLIACVGILSAFLQAVATLRPLNQLRRDVAARWTSEGKLEPSDYPLEVAPLVSDINTLMHRNSQIVSRSRRQAADLAHAIKTPSAIVRNELERLHSTGQPVHQAMDALNRLDAQLKRSFARMRADGGNAAVYTFTDVDAALGRMTRAFDALARNANKRINADIPPGLKVRMDQDDFEEVIGNLLDNAMKWAEREILITARQYEDRIEIRIQDDGPGIPADAHEMATLSGRRLDTSKPGTGLGLAIAADLAHAYGGKVSLGESPKLGGLMASVALKTSSL